MHFSVLEDTMQLNELMCDSLRRATKTLALVNVDGRYKDRVTVMAFANGREQGYHIVVCRPPGSKDLMDRLNLWIAECRGSDEMLLCLGKGYHNEPDDEDWKQGRSYFKSVAELATSITNLIKLELERE